ncbi:MAG: transposase [Pseudomonadota bacterium]|nr:MAG: transposase [Pseudomonadota bacterium]
MFNGLLDWSIWTVIAYTLITTHITIVSVTVYLHRHQTHRALELHPLVSHFFRFWLWLSTGMKTREWVAIHRKHHAFVETEQDPHSPQVRGLRTLLLRGSELYRKAASDTQTIEKYGFGTPDDWVERHVYSASSALGVALYLGVAVTLFGPLGLTIWAVQMLWIPVLAAGVINGIGHFWGYRNYEVPDASRNILPWGILIGGEELHNNHHTHASSARLSDKWWELDIGWLYIRLMCALGLARVKKVLPRTEVVEGKTRLDAEAMKAIVTTRFQVMARYGREVVRKVQREELRRGVDDGCRRLLKGARRLVMREDSLMDVRARRRLDDVLQQNQAMKTVYEYKQRLQQIWQQTAASQEQLVQSIQEWCRQAEASGIKALQDFAHTLHGYTLRPAAI